MKRLGTLVMVGLLAGALATQAEASKPRGKASQAAGSGSSGHESPASSSPVAHSAALAGFALALRHTAVFRNAMPRVIEKGKPDPGSPMVVKGEIEASGGKADAKVTFSVELRPAGGAAIALPDAELAVEGNTWNGQLKGGKSTFIEVYRKGPGTLAPGTKARLAVTLTSGKESVTLESDEITVEKVD